MSEIRYFPLKRFLVVNRGEDFPRTITVLCEGDREISVKHANSFEARRELQYQAKLLGANALLNVHLNYFYDAGGSTRYRAYGTPAVCGRIHRHGSMTAKELCKDFHLPPPATAPSESKITASSVPNDPWTAFAKFIKYAFITIIVLLILNLIN